MESILKIIYDKSISNQILNFRDIEKILELLIIEKHLNDYISDINVQHIRSNNLASYSNYTKKITIYIEKVDQMVRNIETNILNTNILEIMLYKNLSILQVLLHEIEHANQQKFAYTENNIEALIIRLSYLVKDGYCTPLYEYCPEERMAEIKSYNEVIILVSYLNNKLTTLNEILGMEELKRLLRGYHYKNAEINIPIEDYFVLAGKKNLFDSLDISNNLEGYSLNERLKFGFPISKDEYGNSMKKLVLSLNKNFDNRLQIK